MARVARRERSKIERLRAANAPDSFPKCVAAYWGKTASVRRRNKAKLALAVLSHLIVHGKVTIRDLERIAEDRDLHAQMVAPLRYHLLCHYVEHGPGTISQLLAWTAPRMGWKFGMTGERFTYARMIVSACQYLQLPIAPSKSGRTASK